MACSLSSQAAGGMHGETSQIDMALVAQAQALAIEAATLEDLRFAQAVLLPAMFDATLEARLLRSAWGEPPSCGCKLACAAGWQSLPRRSRGGAAEVGRPTPGFDERRRGAQVLGSVGEAVRRGWHAGCRAAACCACPRARASCGRFSGVSHAGAPRLAQSSPRHAASQERPPCAGGMEKNLPKHWQPC